MNPALIGLVFCVLIWHFALSQQAACTEGGLEDSIDCTDVSVDYKDDPTLTREERLRLMDKAFVESLNKFELCQSAREKAKAAGGAGNGGGGSAGTDGSNENGSNGGGAKENAEDSGNGQETITTGANVAGSVATSSMSGTETPQEMAPAKGLQNMKSGTEQGAQEMDESGSKINSNMSHSNGKQPEDIPPAENDDALAAQIRFAAENEPDPVKSKQLWNEYRKYKGMAPKN